MAQYYSSSRKMIGGSGWSSSPIEYTRMHELAEAANTYALVEQYGQKEGMTTVRHTDNTYGTPKWAVQWYGSRPEAKYTIRHPNSSNLLMADGHVETLSEIQFSDLAADFDGRTRPRFTVKAD